METTRRITSLLGLVTVGLIACGSEAEGPATDIGSAGGAGAPKNNTGGSGGASLGNAGSTATGGAASGGEAGFGGDSSTAGSGANAGSGGAAPQYETAFCTSALDAAVEQYEGFEAAYTNPKSIPRSAKNGNVSLVGTGDWTSGFPAGSFWYLYEYTNDGEWRSTAERWTVALEPEKHNGTHHDLGFQFQNTYGNGYRLTQNPAYPEVLVTAATTLIGRFRASTGVIRSWDSPPWRYPVIVDNMMNLELLYFASKHSRDDKFANVANSHADTTLKNHFRPDGSSYHLVDYNPDNGQVIRKQTVQGLADSSSWGRGQAWGIYGFTAAYRETRNLAYLAQARESADYLASHPEMPSDKVPYFDFDAPKRDDVPDHRDASAGAIFASALLELATHVEAADSKRYTEFALEILKSLSSPAYAAAKGTNNHFLLQHSVGHYPANSEIDVAINYADYYYLEALLRCLKIDGR